jgi:hypothetical protein
MARKALRYVQGTIGLMLTYRRSDVLEIKGYSAQAMREIEMIESLHQDMYSLSQGELSHGEVPRKN